MSIYKELIPIIEYLGNIRKLENYIVFDVKFPMNWKVLKKYIVEDKFVNNGSDGDFLSLSFVCEFNEIEIEQTQKNVLGIINYNLEREEKERLFELKINELKGIFEKESLDSLKVLKFDINNEKNKPSVKSKKNETKPEDVGLSSIIAEE